MLLDYAETDWLGSRPVFYNTKTGAISYNINDVIDYSNFSFCPEGLRNYLNFGYTVMGQTMINNVKSLRWDSSICKNEEGRLIIHEYPDSVEMLYGKNIKRGKEVFDEIKEDVACFAREVKDKIVLPLSAGLDSRLLALGCSEGGREKTYAFSYGYSARQRDSFEVVKASMVAEQCGIKWEHILLTHFYDMLDRWYEIYGPSVHMHGMYQMEFYEKIKKKFTWMDNLSLCSGIIGDVWSGNVRIDSIVSPDELTKLGYTHGLCIEEDVCLLGGVMRLRRLFMRRTGIS